VAVVVVMPIKVAVAELVVFVVLLLQLVVVDHCQAHYLLQKQLTTQ
jgi:hypothetical protein